MYLDVFILIKLLIPFGVIGLKLENEIQVDELDGNYKWLDLEIIDINYNIKI